MASFYQCNCRLCTSILDWWVYWGNKVKSIISAKCCVRGLYVVHTYSIDEFSYRVKKISLFNVLKTFMSRGRSKVTLQTTSKEFRKKIPKIFLEISWMNDLSPSKTVKFETELVKLLISPIE